MVVVLVIVLVLGVSVVILFGNFLFAFEINVARLFSWDGWLVLLSLILAKFLGKSNHEVGSEALSLPQCCTGVPTQNTYQESVKKKL